MSEAASIAGLSIWLVCTIGLTVVLIKFTSHARKVDPEGYERMVQRTKRNSKWVMRTFLGNPSRDYWEHHK